MQGPTALQYDIETVIMSEGVTVTDLEQMSSQASGLQSGPERAMAELIVSALQLEIVPEAIDPDMRLFGEGLGLDSIDALELALAITRAYGFELRSDDERNQQIFATLRSLAAYI